MPRNSCSWSLSGTRTFRLSSRKIFNFWGTNLQNPDKQICKIYIPDEGKIFCQVDQSGAEALIVSYLCKDGKFRSLFKYGIKPHVFVALHLFRPVWETKLGQDLSEYIEASPEKLVQLPEYKELDKLIKSSDKWPSNERYYYMAKQVCHSSNYGIQANEFALNVLKNSGGTIVLKVEEAHTFLRIYHNLFPEILDWHQTVKQAIKQKRYITNLFGFTCTFNNFLTDRDFKKAFAWIPQSTVGCITHIAVTNLQNYIEENRKDWDILNNKHDSYLVQCPIGEKEECCKMMQHFMEQELKAPDGTIFRMRSEASTGMNWGEMQ